ncbi:hypothetical protein [Vibrio mediterranei]|uniref:hypothetical protein n=1 Tax=Vibrio mediterranei TaxID=689 RepID=UPI002283A06D|nr:hypothetical protein [Vibrio mediterranei]MCY9852408.1 hypothetical protein [Vibrio mediterranei]
MELQQCWSRFVNAEKLLKQGSWPEAKHLFSQVLDSLPSHVYHALECKQTRPCQFVFLVTGLRDASIYQSSILNSIGEPQQAFETLNRCYALLQFLSLEQTQLIKIVYAAIEESTDLVLSHMEAFCASQHSAEWTRKFNELSRSHHSIAVLNPHTNPTPNSHY